MNKITYAGIALATLLAAPALADVNVVVPGKATGYLYFQTNGDDADGISLAVFKDPSDGKPLYQDYRIESVPAGLVCDESCVETAQKMPEGKIELKIVGKKPIPGMDFPLKGVWSGGCETKEESASCQMTLGELNAQVRVKVNPDLEAGTIIDTDDGPLMFVSMNTAQGYMLVADHNRLGGRMSLMEHDPDRTDDPNIKDSNYGKNNMEKLLKEGSKAAKHCDDLGHGWYLPARYELEGMKGAALTKVPGITASLWSSTEYKFKQEGKPGDKSQKWEYETYYLSRSSSTGHGSMDDMTAYEYKIKDYTKVDKNKTEERQVLCFRRQPL